jgi:RES domain-containing protein
VWRICKQQYADAAFTGIGAKKVGGRWNSPGRALVYTSDSLALAALELLVHVTTRDEPPDLIAVWAEVPDESIGSIYNVDAMPQDWRSVTGNSEVVAMGDQWLQAADSVAMVVPSVVIPEAQNILLNPEHRDFSSVEIGTDRGFSFDRRLFA